MNEQYRDDFKKIEAFPYGKLFRLTYDSDGDMLRIIAKNQTILDGIFGRSLTAEGQYIPLAVSDIEQQLRTETIQED